MKQQHTLQPKLRFPEFEGDWKSIKLENIASKIGSGKTPLGGDKVYQTEGIPFIRSQNVNSDQLILDDTFIPLEVHKSMNTSKVIANDILLNITGASIGRSCVVPNDFIEGNVNQHVCIIRIKNEKQIFIQKIISSNIGQKLIYETQTGSGREGLNFESIKKFKINIPSLPEQQKIADYLSTVDNKINLLEEKKAQLGLYKKAMMQKLFAQEIRFKPSEAEALEAYPEWEEKRLGEISKITTGKLDANAMIPDGEYRFYTCAKEYYKIDKYAFDCEALLISGNGANVGYIHHYNGKFNAYQRTYVLTDLAQNFEFIKYQLDQFLHIRISREKKEGNTPYIVLSTLTEMLLKIPIKQEQQKIADFLSAIDASIEKVTEQISQTQSFKKAMLQQMFV